MENMVLMSGAGNSFCVMDNRSGKARNIVSLTRKSCGRRKLDGGLFVERSQKAAFRMRIINADGSEAEMCGNGVRCIAQFALDRGIVQSRNFDVETVAGIIRVKIGTNGMVMARLTEPFDFRERIKLGINGLPKESCFVNTGVPHAVMLMKSVAGIDVKKLGRIVRNHAYFAPSGANANFVSVRGPHDIAVRTYERGVEDETLACGTGSTASALVTAWLGITKPPIVRVKTRGGEVLRIHFDSDFRQVWLEGPVKYA